MPDPKLLNTMSFEVSQDLVQWLKLNHATESELWIKLYKKSSGIKSITWDDVVIESLCWGWIDGIKKSLDEQSYIQRITPRKARSAWSKRNTKHAERLINESRMMEPGLAHIQAAKADGRWQNAYAVSEMEVPIDFITALDNNLQAKAFYETLNKSSLNAIAYGLLSAKKPETRLRRFTKFMEMLINKQKP